MESPEIIPPQPNLQPGETGSLVTRARSGDSEALAFLLDRYQSRVLRLVRRRIGPGVRRQVESGDVVQEVMAETIRSIQDFTPRDERSFFRWLSCVVENRIRNIARRGTRKPLELGRDNVIQNAESPTQGLSVDRNEEAQYRENLIALAMDQLNEDHQRILRLRNYAELSFGEIADQMERSEEAAWALHKRAKAALVKEVAKLRQAQQE